MGTVNHGAIVPPIHVSTTLCPRPDKTPILSRFHCTMPASISELRRLSRMCSTSLGGAGVLLSRVAALAVFPVARHGRPRGRPTSIWALRVPGGAVQRGLTLTLVDADLRTVARRRASSRQDPHHLDRDAGQPALGASPISVPLATIAHHAAPPPARRLDGSSAGPPSR